MTRLLFRLGLETTIREKAICPDEISLRRWQNGAVVGGFRTGEFEEKYGSPQLQIRRSDLHDTLYQKAQQLSVLFRVNTRVVDYNLDKPLLVLENGEEVEADLVIAAVVCVYELLYENANT